MTYLYGLRYECKHGAGDGDTPVTTPSSTEREELERRREDADKEREDSADSADSADDSSKS